MGLMDTHPERSHSGGCAIDDLQLSYMPVYRLVRRGELPALQEPSSVRRNQT